MEQVHIQDLPTEAFIEIISRVDGITLGICRRVCKKWMECIDKFDQIWEKMCEKEYKNPARIAKTKAGSDFKWQNVYKNMVMWTKLSPNYITVKEFYKFNALDRNHALEIDSNILPLRDTRGIVLYDANTLKYLPVVVPDRNCIKIQNNDSTTAILLKSGLFIQRTVGNTQSMSEAFFEADNFLLTGNAIFFYHNREVFRCDLLRENLASNLILHCKYNIKEMSYDAALFKLHLFTDCGVIVTVNRSKEVVETTMNIPTEWVQQIKHICPIDDRNFVCYSRNLFKIETDMYQHLYLDFPPITALFFYGDFILFATRVGEIMLYPLSNQRIPAQPVFENVAALPDGKFATHIDVVERECGPAIVVATFFEIYIIDINCFPHNQSDDTKKGFPENKVLMFKRLQRLKERLQLY